MKIETVNQGDILEEAIKTYGVESQVNMAIEECAELINALEKYRRGRIGGLAVITEIADVQIMCAQLEIIFGSAEIERDFKIRRLYDRMKKGKND